jgi:hypothetical protein
MVMAGHLSGDSESGQKPRTAGALAGAKIRIGAKPWMRESSRILFLLILPILIRQVDYHSTNEHFTFCLFRNITGRDCYGCGVLRGLSAFLHLDFRMAFHVNKLNLVTIPLLSVIYLKDLVKSFHRRTLPVSIHA